MSFTRVTVRADQMAGTPCIRGLRIPVATVVSMFADGMGIPEILAAYPGLEARGHSRDLATRLRLFASASCRWPPRRRKSR